MGKRAGLQIDERAAVPSASYADSVDREAATWNGVVARWKRVSVSRDEGTYRLRIELPDRPGALAGVTSEIAGSDANIVSIDVHEVDGSTAIDEIVVEVTDSWAPGALAASMARSGVGNLLSSRQVVASDDPVTAVDLLGELLSAGARLVGA